MLPSGTALGGCLSLHPPTHKGQHHAGGRDGGKNDG